MFKLNFDNFMEYYEQAMRTRNQDQRKLHYFEDSEKFVLYIKSVDYWEYYTEVMKADIINFGNVYGVGRIQAIEDFKMNLLYHALKIEEEMFPKVVKEMETEIQKGRKEEVEEEAKDYAGFLQKEFGSWEKQIMSFIDETLDYEFIEKGVNAVNKNFSEFMRRVFNVVNTSGFVDKLGKIIRNTIKNGIEEAEDELQIDIGFGPEIDDKVNETVARQMDGFFIEGKPWSGIKGATEDLQREIREEVVKGIETKKTLKEMKTTIKDTFTKFVGGEREEIGTLTEGRLMRIARTESVRIKNASKQRAYEKSGIVKGKRYEAFIDDRTSPQCKRLNGQEVPLDKNFMDPETGFEYDHPPVHCNCRSGISAILID